VLKLVAGAILGSTVYFVTRHALLSVIGLAVVGIVCQVAYATRLNASLKDLIATRVNEAFSKTPAEEITNEDIERISNSVVMEVCIDQTLECVRERIDRN